MTNRDPCLALLLNQNNTSQRSHQERQETLLVQVLFLAPLGALAGLDF